MADDREEFFKNIYHDLYYDVYKAMGSSLEDEAVNWSLYLSKIASTGIKILILVAILAAVYRAVLLVIRYNRLIHPMIANTRSRFAWRRGCCGCLPVYWQ